MPLHRVDAEGMQRQKADLLAVFREVYAKQLSQSFFDPSRFWERLEAYASRPGFRLVTARVEDELIGYTLGAPLAATTRWCRASRETLTLSFSVRPAHGRSPSTS
jgi:hypothetical protein